MAFDATQSGDPYAADLAIVRAACSRERHAMESLFERLECVPRIVGALNRSLGAPLDVDEQSDLVQDVLIVLWKKFEEYKGEARIETYAYRVCRFELLNAARKKRRRRSLDAEASSETGETHGEHENRQLHVAESLARGLSQLDAEEAAIVRLKHYESMKFEEIAQRLKISVNTIKTRYYRALSRLKVLLADGAAELGS